MLLYLLLSSHRRKIHLRTGVIFLQMSAHYTDKQPVCDYGYFTCTLAFSVDPVIPLSGCFMSAIKNSPCLSYTKTISVERIMNRIILGIVCILLSGFANAQDVHHPENRDIVGLVEGATLCFQNDGAVLSTGDCLGDHDPVDEGWVRVVPANWYGGPASGINACGDDDVNPVSSADCPFTKELFATCIGNGYVLVQTTKSGHFWAVRPNVSCNAIAKIVPCRSTDTFNKFNGCVSVNPPTMGIEGGYIKLDTYTGYAPPYAHCTEESHYGRMAFEAELGVFYICSTSGWIVK